MRLGSLLEGAGVRYCLSYRDVDILGVADDSRRVKAGYLFVAVRGALTDGHRYLRDALARGAGAVAVEDASAVGREWPAHVPVVVVSDGRASASRIASRFYREPARRIRVVGITGTNGKTTASYYVRSILEAAGYGAGLMGTIAVELGGRALPARNTTPGALEAHALLREMETRGLRFAVMEISSHALDQGRVADIPFAAAACTNVTADHLDYHGNRAEYLRAKCRLFHELEPKSLAVLNADDWSTAAFASSCRARKVKYGRGPEADLRYLPVRTGLNGSALFLTWRGRPVGGVRLRMPGLHNAANAAAAAALGLAMGLKEAAVVKGIEEMTGVPGRLEQVSISAPFKVFVDYAHTENALEAVLSGIRNVHRGRLLVVFGCGGDRDRTKRPRMGTVVGRFADHCWITSDNPRNEDPDAIIQEIERGFPVHAWYAVEPNRERAIFEALAYARPGDAVVIAGKGHESTQTIGNDVRSFDDRNAVRSAWNRIAGEGEHSRCASTVRSVGAALSG